MKILRFPLHIQIILALILGAIFGILFSVDHNALKIYYLKGFDEEKIEIENWKSITFFKKQEDTIIKLRDFSSSQQIPIINFFKELPKADKEKLILSIKIGDKQIDISHITKIEKIGTIATSIKPFGTIFIRLLSFLAIPLVIASLIVGASSLDLKRLGRIGIRTFLFYVATTIIAITIGLLCANIIEPGKKISVDTRDRMVGEFKTEASEKMVSNLELDIPDFIVNIVPKNPIQAMSEGNMLQIVFFAVLFGITLTFIDRKKSSLVTDFFSGISETMIKMVGFVMKVAPIGVFALISSIIADFGFEIIITLFWYIFTVLLALFIHTVFIYSSIVKFFGKTKPSTFFKAMQEAIVIAFSSSSSAATLPVTMSCVEKNLNVPKHISGFVLPLGATINMDGTALYQGVAAVFIAQVYGIDLGLTQQLTIILIALLASIGTAPVPGVGIIMLVMILQSVHIPPEGIALIIGVDRILDMSRTITNICGDASVATAISAMESKNS